MKLKLETDLHVNPPRRIGWKATFTDGETIVIKGIGFYVAAVNRRGITLRRVRQEPKDQT